MSLGNDVVDLEDPETHPDALHIRFDERVFCQAERAALEASSRPDVVRWTLWAAKESAYKATKRLDPALVFSPQKFRVELTSSGRLPWGVKTGRVVHQGNICELGVRVSTTCIHAVAVGQGFTLAQVLSRVAETEQDTSASVRRMAIEHVGAVLGLGRDDLRIVGRPPLLIHKDHALDATVSLSHHGRFAAFACALSTQRRVADGE
jgi:phosphopantetheinyl transferase (holo-ACP synthase)